MSVTSKTATAAIALMIAAGAYPIASVAQSQTETDAVEVEVIEQGAESTGEAVEQSASEAGQAIGQAAEETGEMIEQGGEAIVEGAEEAGETVVEGAEATGEAVEQGVSEAGEGAEEAGETVVEGAEATGEAVEQGVSEAGEAADEATGTTVEVIEQDTDEAAGTATVTEEGTGEPATATVVEEDAGEAAGTAEVTEGETAVIDAEVEETGADLDEAQMQELEQAEAEGRPVPPAEMIMGSQKDGQWLSSDLIDREVRNPEGEVIGDIGGILFSDQGPDGVIVEVGGFLGIGEKEVAIKWSELSMTPDGIIVQATEEQLENAPEFVSMEERQMEAEAQAQQEVVVDEDQGMMTSGNTGVVGEEPAAGLEAETEVDTTQ